MFTETNQLSVSGGWGATFLEVSGDLQAAYAVTNHFAVMVNGSMMNYRAIYSPTNSYGLIDDLLLYQTVYYRRTYVFGEAAVGYFMAKDKIRFETFAGYGIGNSYGKGQYDFFGDEKFLVRANFERIFFQPSLSFKQERHSVTLTPKFTAVNFKSFSTDDEFATSHHYTTDGSFKVFFEPSVNFRFRISNNFDIFIQPGYSVPLNGEPYYSWQPFRLGTGLLYHLSLKKKDDN